MRKIHFNEETISAIRDFVECGHTIEETCNRFTLKNDTLRRVLFENNIKPKCSSCDSNRKRIMVYDDIPQDTIKYVCDMYMNTNITIQDLCKDAKLPNYAIQIVLDRNFTQQERDSRKSKLYRLSKLGTNNPMSGKCGELHHNYKGLVEDGNGYLLILKPDWYTGRCNSKHIFYHHYVMCKHLGITQIPKGFVVHHIDYNKKNNDISNLALVTISAHGRLHSLERQMQGAETIHKGVGETPNAEQ